MQFDPIVAQNKQWKVELVFLGDGLSGPYQQEEADPESDCPMVRSIVYRAENNKWKEDPQGNFLTYLQATDKRNVLEKAAKLLLQKISENTTMHSVNLYNYLSYIHVYKTGVRIDIPYDERD